MSNRHEARASHVLSEVLGGSVVWRDTPEAPSGTHDFDLEFVDGRTIAVEVTISTDQRLVEFWHAVGDQSWQSPQLLHSWIL